MKKIYFLLAITLFATTAFAQKVLILNGGKYGDPSENVNLVIYDIQNDAYSQIDTIYTSSIQEMVIDSNILFVAAQDSIVKYDLITESRIAATAFPGLSTKDLCVANNSIWASNFYGQSSNNIYVFDKNSLQLIDTIVDASTAVSSMVADQNYLYATQNQSTSSYTDTLGTILKIDLSSRQIVDTLRFKNYAGDIGQLILKQGHLIAINSTSNTIGSIDLVNQKDTIYTFSLNLQVKNKSTYSINADTLFAKMNGIIGAINLNNMSVIDSSIVDTVVTAFSYNHLNSQFYISQTDFYSFQSGAIYNRSGQKLDTLKVGFSPEGMRIYYNQSVGLAVNQLVKELSFTIYPNPALNKINVSFVPNAVQAEISVFNQMGAMVHQQKLNAFEIISLDGLSKGVYFVKLQAGSQVGVQKLIIQ